MMWGIRPGSDFSAFRLTEWLESRQNVGRLVFSALLWPPGRWLSDTWGRVAVFFRGERSVGMTF